MAYINKGLGTITKDKYGRLKCTAFMMNETPKPNPKEPDLVRVHGWIDWDGNTKYDKQEIKPCQNNNKNESKQKKNTQSKENH